MKLKQLLFIMVCVFSASVCWSASSFPDRYDTDIEAAATRYLPQTDWRLLKAQYYQESRLQPDAVSPVGAVGIAQFMPGTWADVSRSLGFEKLNRRMAQPAILAGAYYMAKLHGVWKAPRPAADRHSLAMASYNAGAGHLIKAQRLCGGVNAYAEIARCLPRVTGHHSRETITYVQRIWKYWTQMVFLG